MKTRILPFCLPLFCLAACISVKEAPVPVAVREAPEYAAALWDFFQINPHQIMPGNRNFMQPASVVSGGDFTIDSVQFTAGLIDFDGDGRFNEVDDDRIFLTVYKNRRVRFNNGYGTPVAPISMVDNVLQVDDRLFRVSFAAEDGKRMAVKPIDRPIAGAEVLKMETSIPDIELEDYLGRKVRLRDFIDHRHQIYLAFWALPAMPMEFENFPARHLMEVQRLYSDSVRIVSIQYTGLDDPSLYKMNADLFLQMIGQPWLSLKCDDSRILNRMHQDLSYNQGTLTDKQGKYKEMYLLWRDMAENFPYMR